MTKDNALTKRKYDDDIVEYTKQSLSETEQKMYDNLFHSIRELHQIAEPSELMMLDMSVIDFIRVKRLQIFNKIHGEVSVKEDKDGNPIIKTNSSAFLQNAIETQFRNNMRELMLTRKELMKKKLNVDSEDFASFLSSTKVVESEEVKKDDKKGKGKTGTIKTDSATTGNGDRPGSRVTGTPGK